MFSNSFTGTYSDASNFPLSKLQRPNISFDTSSKDPQMLSFRSRIFVGGLNTNTVTRDDVIQLFSSYGTILGVTLFKGYAFVQYSNLSEADLAVSALNLYHWHGSALDVKIVAKDSKAGSLAAESSNGTVGKRPAQNEQLNEAKKGRPQSNLSLDSMCELRGEISDVFICGVCRFTSSFLENFIFHRKKSCDLKSGRKLEGEPDNYECNSCIEKFITCWELIEHLSKCHNLAVYRDAIHNASLEKKDVKAEVQ